MTKEQLLKSNAPTEIWEEMQKNPEWRADGELWLHLTRLTAKLNREWSERTYGDPEAYMYMDPMKKKRNSM